MVYLLNENSEKIKEVAAAVQWMCAQPKDRIKQEDLQYLAAGSYNVIFLLKDEFVRHYAVLRLSMYESNICKHVRRLVRSHICQADDGTSDPGEASDAQTQVCCTRDMLAQVSETARQLSHSDIIYVKNHYSLFGNLLITQRVCPHFVYMYKSTHVTGFAERLGALLEQDRRKNKLSFRYNNISFHQRFTGNLSSVLVKLSEEQLVAVVFQVVHALMCMQHYFPKFRHNDASLNNILVKTYKSTGRVYGYRMPNGDVRYVRDLGVHAALADFDLAHAPYSVTLPPSKGFSVGKTISLSNAMIRERRFEQHQDVFARLLAPDYNPSFDLYYFFYRLYEAIRTRNADPKSGPPAHLKVLGWIESFNCLMPRRKYTKIIRECLVPKVLIAHPFFDQMHVEPINTTCVFDPFVDPCNLGITIIEEVDNGKKRKSDGRNSDVIIDNKRTHVEQRFPGGMV